RGDRLGHSGECSCACRRPGLEAAAHRDRAREPGRTEGVPPPYTHEIAAVTDDLAAVVLHVPDHGVPAGSEMVGAQMADDPPRARPNLHLDVRLPRLAERDAEASPVTPRPQDAARKPEVAECGVRDENSAHLARASLRVRRRGDPAPSLVSERPGDFFDDSAGLPRPGRAPGNVAVRGALEPEA